MIETTVTSRRQRRSLDSILEPLEELAIGSPRLFRAHLGYFDSDGLPRTLPKYLFIGPGDRSSYLRIGIFAGIHGDELPGVLATIRLLEQLHKDPESARGYELYVYPVGNPTGFADNTRWSRTGRDLNREFWRGTREPEVILLEQQLTRLNFDGIISLHTDDTSEGIYGFANGNQLTRHVLEPALDEASLHLPRNDGRLIDNFDAENGIIEQCYEGVLSAPPSQHPRPFEVVFETPHYARIDKQIAAHIAAVYAILARYRVLISEAQNI